MKKITSILTIIISIAIVACVIGFYSYVYIKYGDVPVSELPSWVFFFMHGGKR